MPFGTKGRWVRDIDSGEVSSCEMFYFSQYRNEMCSSCDFKHAIIPISSMVEYMAVNHGVAGSSPAWGAIILE